jgi:hypothetical protein
MITLDDHLPPGALCDAEGALAAALADDGAIWWAGSGLIADATGAVTGWRAGAGGPVAVPTAPNNGHGQIGEAGDLTGLLCRDGVHCGLVAQDVAPDAGRVTLAARYLPPWGGAEAKTIVTLNTNGGAKKTEGGNYLYLSEAEGQITVKDDAGGIALHLPAPAQDGPRLVLVSLDSARLAVAVMGGQRHRGDAQSPILSGMGHLFVGCRNQRPGLTKTLGAALICDVWLWPGRTLLGSDRAEDRASCLALERFWLWSEGA